MSDLVGLFYIVCVNEDSDWWQLRKVSDHQIVSCGKGKDFVMEALKRLVENYKNAIHLEGQWSLMEYQYNLKEKELLKREGEYKEWGEIYRGEIDSIINKYEVKPPLLDVGRRRDIVEEQSSQEGEKEKFPVTSLRKLVRGRLKKVR